MGWTLTYHLLPLFATGAVSALLMLVVWNHRMKQGARPLLLIMIGVVGWTSIMLVQIASNDPALITAGDLAKMLFIPMIAVGTFTLSVVYTNNEQLLTRPVLAGVLSIPLLTWTVVIIQALGGPPLLYTTLDTSLETVGGTQLLLPHPERGPWFFVHVVHSYVLLLSGALLLMRSAIGTWSVYRGQAIALVIAVFAPIGTNLPSLANLTVIDYTPFGFGITVIAIAWALFRYELLDLVPVARDTVIEEMRDAVIVLDNDGRIIDANAAATPIVGPPDEAIGKPGSELLSFDIGSYTVNTDGGWQELAIDHDGRTAHYRLESTAIKGRKGQRTGTLLVLQDITEIKRREQQLRETSEELEILNRVVRHDIQNDMNVVAGHAQVLDDAIDDDSLRPHIEPIRHNSEHAIELTETVRDLIKSTTGDGDLELEAVNLQRTVNEEVEKARQTFDDATIEFDRTDQQLTVSANSMLSSVFKNLFSNAVRHNDTDDTHITVNSTLDENEEYVRVEVADNGPGVPDDQKSTVFGRGEKGLDSPGTGIGLYLVDTLVTGYGGEVWIEDNDPRGSVFVVELPVIDS